MEPLPKIFVGNVGLKSVTICGESSKRYLNMPNSRFTRGCVVIDFDSEKLMLNFVQSLMDEAMPFESTYKNDPARDAVYFRGKGVLVGDITCFDWGAGGAIYKTAK